MDSLDESVQFVFFYNTNLSFDEILDFACDELDIETGQCGRLQKLQILNQFLITQLEQSGTVVALLIDEAQNLDEDVLESLRLLSNLETSTEKLLQIVLVGQPELEGKLAQPALRQLKQRIATRYRLDRLKDRDIGPFINYRLHTAGYQGPDLFTPEALQRIVVYAKGIPRVINLICDNALLVAYGLSQTEVSADIIDEVARDLALTDQKHRPSTPFPLGPFSGSEIRFYTSTGGATAASPVSLPPIREPADNWREYMDQ